jgi:hypothetical protein
MAARGKDLVAASPKSHRMRLAIDNSMKIKSLRAKFENEFRANEKTRSEEEENKENKQANSKKTKEACSQGLCSDWPNLLQLDAPDVVKVRFRRLLAIGIQASIPPTTPRPPHTHTPERDDLHPCIRPSCSAISACRACPPPAKVEA